MRIGRLAGEADIEQQPVRVLTSLRTACRISGDGRGDGAVECEYGRSTQAM